MRSLANASPKKATTEGKQGTMVSIIRWQMAAGNQKYDGAKEISICWMDSKSGNIRRSLRSRWSRYLCLPNSPQNAALIIFISNQLASAIWISSWHQQLESAVYISRPQKQVKRPRDGMIAWTWTTYCKWLRSTQVKDWALQCILLFIFISNQLTSASTSAANCDCSQCTYRQQASHPDR